MNAQNQISVPDAATIDTLPYRAAIDRVATLRTLAMRVALIATQLSDDRPEDRKVKLRETVSTHARTLGETVQVLEGQQTFDTLPEELSMWLAGISSQQPGLVSVMGRMASKTDKLAQQAQSDSGVPSEELESFIGFAQSDFFEAVTALTEAIWSQIEDGRALQLERAMQSASRLGEGLNRLERIGKYVRSMSINASVEASRAGEAGKGLAIIAQEFKVLAEEVQQLTFSARQDIETIENS